MLRVEQSGIVAVLVIDDSDMAVRLARTLVDNGINAMELTLRTDAALESLRIIRREVPDMFAGIGTILTPSQVTYAKDGGAHFGVAPGFNPSVVGKARELGFPFAPGIATPSDIEGAVSMGCSVLKYFHAEGMGGPAYLKGINAPYSFMKLKYIPLGGLKPSNIKTYLELPEVLAIGGSWIASKGLINREDWDTIGRNAAEASAILREIRG